MKALNQMQVRQVAAGKLEAKPAEMSHQCWTALDILYSLYAAHLISDVVVSSGLYHVCTASDYQWLLKHEGTKS